MARDLKPIRTILNALLDDIQEIKHVHQHISAPQMATAFSVPDRQPILDSYDFGELAAGKGREYCGLIRREWVPLRFEELIPLCLFQKIFCPVPHDKEKF